MKGPSRGQLMEQLIGRGIDNPERLTAELEASAIEGAIRWYDSQMQLGKKVGSGLLATKLRNGGLDGFGVVEQKLKPWWGDTNARAAWVEEHVPDIDPVDAEAAVISLAHAKRDVTPEAVRAIARADTQLTDDYYAGNGEFQTRLSADTEGRWFSYVTRKR